LERLFLCSHFNRRNIVFIFCARTIKGDQDVADNNIELKSGIMPQEVNCKEGGTSAMAWLK
jgi:hypothetical protein